MIRFTRAVPSIAITVVLAATTGAAQKRWTVGTGGLATIRAALALARSGDEILIVSKGVYGPIDVRAGVTIRAAPNLQIIIFGVRCQLTGTEAARFSDLSLSMVTLARGSGSTSFENCQLFSSALTDGPTIVADGARAFFHNCDIRASSRYSVTFNAVDSLVAIRGGRVEGRVRTDRLRCEDSVALRLRDCAFTASDTRIEGGRRVFCSQRAEGVAIRTEGATRLRITASTVAGGDDGNGQRSAAIDSAGSRPVEVFRTVVLGATRGPVRNNAALLGSTQTGEPRLGMPFSGQILGRSGEAYALIASTRLTVNFVSSIPDILWFRPGASSPAIGFGVLPASGMASFRFPVPARSALRGRTIWVHGIGLAPTGIAVALPVGGEIR